MRRGWRGRGEDRFNRRKRDTQEGCVQECWTQACLHLLPLPHSRCPEAPRHSRRLPPWAPTASAGTTVGLSRDRKACPAQRPAPRSAAGSVSVPTAPSHGRRRWHARSWASCHKETFRSPTPTPGAPPALLLSQTWGGLCAPRNSWRANRRRPSRLVWTSGSQHIIWGNPGDP